MAVQNLPIDPKRMSIPIVVAMPEIRTNPETKEIKTDRDGNTQWRVAVAASMIGRRLPDVFDVTVSVQPENVAIGTPVKLVNLVARPWQMGDRSGLSFSADEVIPAVPPGASIVTTPAARPGKSGDA